MSPVKIPKVKDHVRFTTDDGELQGVITAIQSQRERGMYVAIYCVTLDEPQPGRVAVWLRADDFDLAP